MSDEISNKTLAMLLVAAIVVSLGGTLVSLNKLSRFNTAGITGLASASGEANLTISETVSITLLDGKIEFGSGIVNTTLAAQNATLISNHTNAFPRGTWDWTAADTFVIQNNGNIEANVSVYAEDPTSWIGGTLPNAWFAVSGGEGGIAASCTGDPQTTWDALNNTINETVCSELEYDPANRELNVSVKVQVPFDAPTATELKQNTVIFYAFKSTTSD